MTDDINGLKRLFSDQDDDEDKREGDTPEDGDAPFRADDTPEAGHKPEDADAGEPLDDTWNSRKKFGAGQEADIPAHPDDRFNDKGLREKEEKPFTPQRVDRSSANDAFSQMAIENLRLQKREREEEKTTEREDTFRDDTPKDTPDWAIKAKADEPAEVPAAKASMNSTEDDQPAEAGKGDVWRHGRTDPEPDEVISPPPEPKDDRDRMVRFREKMSSDKPAEPEPVSDSYDDEPVPSTGGRDKPELEDEGQDVGELRDLVFKREEEDDKKPKRKRPAYVEPTLEINPLVSFIGLIGTLCIGVAFLMSLLGARAGIGMTGLAGTGLIMLIVYAAGNRRNLKLVLSARSTRLGANVLIVIGTLFAIIVVLNGISYGHYYVLDMTSENSQSLSEQTLTVLAGLKASGATVKATVFIKGEAEYREMGRTIEDTLEKYAHLLPNLDINYLDPDVNRQRADDFNFEQPVGVVFELGDKFERAVEFSDKSGWVDYEAAFTDALLRLTGVHAKRIYFLTGHKELSTVDGKERSSTGVGLLVSELESVGFQVESLSLASKPEIPADCDLLVAAGPEMRVPQAQLDAISKYLDSGGRVMLLLEARNDAGFGPMLAEFGIRYRSDLIEDKVNNQAGSNSLHPLLELSSHPINVPLKSQNMEIFFFRASGMDIDSEPRPGWVLEPLLRTMAGGSESIPDEGTNVEGEEEIEKIRGPFTMAVIAGKPVVSGSGETSGDVEGEPGALYGRLFVAGDASFAANKNLYTGGGSDFILNSVTYLTSNIPDLSIRAREPQKYLSLSKTKVNISFLITTIFIPLLIAGLGVFVWVKRR